MHSWMCLQRIMLDKKKKKKKSSLKDYILYESIHSSLEMTKLEMMDRLMVAKLPWCLRE